MPISIHVDRGGPVPLYVQIKDQVRRLILAGDLPAGSHLPTERELAAAVGVNRSTVSTAYAELAACGLVQGRVGRGTIVCSLPEAGAGEAGAEGAQAQPLPWDLLFATGRGDDISLARDPLPLCASEGVISLAGGTPDPSLFPVQRFMAATDTVLRREGRSLLQYSQTEGHPPLRETLAALAMERGIAARPDNTLVVSGSQQGLDLVSRALIEPGDPVVVEVPSYLGAISVFRAAGARLLGVPVDEQGMRTDVLERLLARYRPRLIYTLPSFQNPSGMVMSAGRRQDLLSLAQHHQVPVVEDDPYGDLYFADRPPPPVKSLDRRGHVIYLATFSKALFPGIRIGWLVAPCPVVERLARLKQYADLHSNTLAQGALDEFIRRGWLREHLAKSRPVYQRKCEEMLTALQDFAPHGLRWSEPSGGFNLWCQLDAGLRSRDLLFRAGQRQVAFVIGEAFHADGGGQQSFRLNYSYEPEARIREGVKRLAAALKELIADRAGQPVAQAGAGRPIV